MNKDSQKRKKKKKKNLNHNENTDITSVCATKKMHNKMTTKLQIFPTTKIHQLHHVIK
jgi:hypothetical protein